MGVLAVEALLAVAFTIWPPAPENRAINAALAGLLAIAALLCAAMRRHRGSLRLLEVCLTLAWGMPMLAITAYRLETIQLMWALVLLLVTMIVAFYLPPRGAAYQIAGMLAVFLAAALAFEPRTQPLLPAVFVTVAALTAISAAWVRADRDRLLATIAEMATTDPLTGLLNRRGLEYEASVVHANATRAGHPTIVAMLDLDGLKNRNDTRGHDAGDEFITGVAAHWRANLRKGDIIARTGGDEFVIVLPQATEITARDLLTRIRDSAPDPWSHGWTVWEPDETLHSALERADALMYADKASRKARRDTPLKS